MEAYKANLEIMRSMITRRGDPYGLLSFLQETIDSMRTDFFMKDAGPEFYDAFEKVLDALDKVPPPG
jgi:hypothetical protein